MKSPAKQFRIKVKTTDHITIITDAYTCADLAWSHAWLIAGSSPATISVQVLP